MVDGPARRGMTASVADRRFDAHAPMMPARVSRQVDSRACLDLSS